MSLDYSELKLIDGQIFTLKCCPSSANEWTAVAVDEDNKEHDAGTWPTLNEAVEAALRVGAGIAKERNTGKRIIVADHETPEYADAIRALARLARRWKCDLLASTFQFWGEDGVWVKIRPRDEKLPEDAEKWVERAPGSGAWHRWGENEDGGS